MATQGIDVRQTSGQLIFRALLLDSTGAIITAGTATLYLYELQDDGTLHSYDWDDDTFKSGALTTETVNMTHRQGNNNTTDTGVWTYELETLSDFNNGQMYVAYISHASLSPAVQAREFQFGNAQGDMTVTAARLNVNVEAIDEGTDEAARLEAALTTANGIDINLGQSTGTPGADTTGEGLRNAHEGIPNATAGGNGGLPTVDASNYIAGIQGALNTLDDVGTLLLVSSVMDTASTVSALIATVGSLPSGHADDDYNDLLVIAKDVGSGSRVNVRMVTDYDQTTRTFTLNQDLDFTPAISTDTFQVFAVSDSSTLSEILKVSTGFTVTNHLQKHVAAMMNDGASNPTGVGDYDAATDSLEAIRDRIRLMEGSGFNTSTDSLEALRDFFAASVAPAIATSSALSGSGFLSECVTTVREMMDEPSDQAKYSDSRVVKYLQRSFSAVMTDLQVASDHALLVRHSVSVSGTTVDYVLPMNIGEIWRVAKINSSTKLPEWELWGSSEHSWTGYGFSLEGNILHLMTPWNSSATLEILYVPNGEAYLHKATASSGTTSTIVFPSSVTDGTLDVRPHCYAGSMIRILSGTGAGQERAVESYDVDTRTAVPRPDWDTAPDNTSIYEVLPQYTTLIEHAICIKTALSLLSNEANAKRHQLLALEYQSVMRNLRLQIGKKGARHQGYLQGDTVDNEDRYGLWLNYGW